MAAAAIKMTMKTYANVDVELSKAVAVLMVLLTAEAVSSRMEGTQPCKDFTKTSHIKDYSIIFILYSIIIICINITITIITL